MAVTTEQVLSAISEYREANARPCPAKYLVEKFGDEATAIIATLKDNGTLIGKRGRTGGLVPADAAPATDTGTNVVESESVADQFAALAAKLASDEVSVEAANG
jgi:hypothetical protein